MISTMSKSTRKSLPGIFCLVLNCSILFTPEPVTAQKRITPGKAWEKVENPGILGWSLEKLNLAEEYSKSIGSAAVMIIENGVIVTEWGETSRNLHIFSIRKSFLSALYGIFIHKGDICITSTLDDLGIDDVNPPLTAKEKKARIVDLLKVRSGVYHPAVYETPGMKKNRPERESHEPGTFWYYNNWDFNALGTIFERVTNISIFDAFKIELVDPLQMEDFRLNNTEYIFEEVSMHPATVFRMSARDLARFGLLYLYEGEWNGKQIIPKSWVKESTTAYSDLGILGGYGYMWWVALNGEHFPFLKFPDGTFSARGTGEQVVLIIPEMSVVIVHSTIVEGSKTPMMKVTDFARLLKKILDAKIE